MKNCFSFLLSFKGIIQGHSVKTCITHSKYLTPRLKEDNDPISAKSAAQIVSLNLQYLT